MAALQAALVAGGMGAFAGALVGALTLGGRSTAGIAIPDAASLSFDQRISIGAFLLAGHVVAAAALWQLPTVGSCFAGGLGAGWIGAAAAGLVGLMRQSDNLPRRLLDLGFRLVVGFTLMAPLWAYVQILYRHAPGPNHL